MEGVVAALTGELVVGSGASEAVIAPTAVDEVRVAGAGDGVSGEGWDSVGL